MGSISERLRAPANAILFALGMAVILLLFSNFSILKAIGLGFLAPNADPNLDGKLNLVASAWFTIVASGLSWILPGVNAVLARFTRPDLVKDAPFIRLLPWIGAVWLVFTVVLYWFAAINPILQNVTGAEASPFDYLNATGISFAIVIALIGVVWYVIQAIRNRQRGVETQLMYRMLPPD
jgi:hypothetical protein